jgi:HEAT repeat protein
MSMPRRFSAKKRVALLAMAAFICGPSPRAAEPINPNSAEGRSGVAQILIALLEKADSTKISADDYASTSLQQIVTFGTPAGFRIKLRYLDFGVSLVEALKSARDPDLRKRMIEIVQWSRNPQVRAEAIVTLASLLDPSHKRYFKEALLDSKIGIRFAAVEALQKWALPEAIPLLHMAMDRDWSPLMKIFASQALLSLGDQSGLTELWKGLDHESWVVRAMSARYLGEYASPDDYTKLVTYMNRETKNDFVAAELATSALKLISRKGEKMSYSPASSDYRKNDEVGYTVGKDQVVELEPLIIIPPQLHIPPSMRAAAQINNKLFTLIKDRKDFQLEPVEAQDPILQELNAMVTPTGFALKVRYSQLSYLLIEGLAGTTDPVLSSELRRMAAAETNALMRATALLAIAYNRNENDSYLFRDALNSKSATVRMGALEGIDIGRFRSALPSVSAVSASDASPAIQIYALQLMAKFGDSSARQILLSRINDPDWPARAMTYWTLSRYGDPVDYGIIHARLNSEENPFVQAEIALACLKLAPVE